MQVTGRPSLWASPAFIHHLQDSTDGSHWTTERSWRFVSDCIAASVRPTHRSKRLFCSRAFVVSQLDSPQNILAHTYRKGDVVVWDELGGVLHSGTVFGPPYMRGERLLRKLPPGDARHKRRRHKDRE